MRTSWLQNKGAHTAESAAILAAQENKADVSQTNQKVLWLLLRSQMWDVTQDGLKKVKGMLKRP